VMGALNKAVVRAEFPFIDSNFVNGVSVTG
jgi:hypothetical protein